MSTSAQAKLRPAAPSASRASAPVATLTATPPASSTTRVSTLRIVASSSTTRTLAGGAAGARPFVLM
ncbi:MAG: hypothetical protein QM765_08145 [Myxococcales bacterium]